MYEYVFIKRACGNHESEAPLSSKLLKLCGIKKSYFISKVGKHFALPRVCAMAGIIHAPLTEIEINPVSNTMYPGNSP